MYLCRTFTFLIFLYNIYDTARYSPYDPIFPWKGLSREKICWSYKKMKPGKEWLVYILSSPSGSLRQTFIRGWSVGRVWQTWCWIGPFSVYLVFYCICWWFIQATSSPASHLATRTIEFSQSMALWARRVATSQSNVIELEYRKTGIARCGHLSQTKRTLSCCTVWI